MSRIRQLETTKFSDRDSARNIGLSKETPMSFDQPNLRNNALHIYRTPWHVERYSRLFTRCLGDSTSKEPTLQGPQQEHVYLI